TVSTFQNPQGFGVRAGAAIPGYVGFIPGKVAGNCFGKRFAVDNLHGTETRQLNGAEQSTNWIVASETNRRRLAEGSYSLNENFQFPRSHPVRDASAKRGDWKLWEPRATHEWLRY
ncbi:unnamed protein product, partial [Polarella glacialis]